MGRNMTEDKRRRIRAAIEANPRKMTMQLARELAVPEAEVIRAFPPDRVRKKEPRNHAMKILVMMPLAFFCLWVVAGEQVTPQTETTAGWVKHPKNPVLGGDLGTCFDISVLKEGDIYRMWLSWRPKKSIALVESKDGVQWSKPLIVLGPNEKTDWENDVNRPVVIKNGDRYQMWYTGAGTESVVDRICHEPGRKGVATDQRQASSIRRKAVGESGRDVPARYLR
jgi:hypothetical protein